MRQCTYCKKRKTIVFDQVYGGFRVALCPDCCARVLSQMIGEVVFSSWMLTAARIGKPVPISKKFDKGK